MRLIFIPILLLSLPVLLIAHRQQYSMSLQGPLYVSAGTALSAPEFAQVKPSLNYMDVTLKGVVADLATRDKARKLVDDLHGLRCRPQDNLIQVTARLSGKLTGNKLAISGWLHDEVALRDVTRWLSESRPGLEIDTDGVQVSPHVTVEDTPSSENTPGAFRSVWSAIEMPASLKVTREGDKVTASGNLPSAPLKYEVLAAISPPTGKGTLDAEKVRAGVYVRRAKFAVEPSLPDFLKAFFGAPGAFRFEADEKTVRASGYATPAMQRDWLRLLDPITAGMDVDTKFEVFPSVQHFPGYQPESKGPQEAMTVLKDVLKAATVNFGPGYATTESTEEPKMTAAAKAIIAAGAEVRIVLGSHVDSTGDAEGNLKMAQRRAEHVMTDLTGKGVPTQCLEIAVLESVPDGVERSRQVEFVIK